MATLKQKIDAERRGREMLKDGGLPQPDHVEYGYTCIRFFFLKSRTVLVIDIDEPPPGFQRLESAEAMAMIDDEDEL